MATAQFYDKAKVDSLLAEIRGEIRPFDRIVSDDGSHEAVMNDDGTVEVSAVGADTNDLPVSALSSGEIRDWDDLAAAAGVPSATTPDAIRTALNLPLTATVQEAIDAAEALSANRVLAFQNAFAVPFMESKAYAVGDTVSYNGLLYECTTEHSAGAWDSDDFSRFMAGDVLEDVSSALDAIISNA